MIAYDPICPSCGRRSRDVFTGKKGLSFWCWNPACEQGDFPAIPHEVKSSDA